jgi:hypothetical protein
MDLLKTIGEAWGWKGIEPIALVETNLFGNVIVRTASGHFWRICPEDLKATQLAASEALFDDVRFAPEFVEDWNMTRLVQKAQDSVGELSEGRCYCLKIPSVLGGEYGGSNLATIKLSELLSFSGDLAKQIDGLPEGSKIRLKVVK